MMYIMPALIGAITSIILILLNNIRDRRNFERDHNYEQLKELYLELYAVVVQSEYLRYFFNKYKDRNFVFWEIPFIETARHKTKYSEDGEVITEQEIKDVITEFNKTYIIDKVMRKKSYASQDLLKLTVAYRYSNNHYLNKYDIETKNAFQMEEVKLIYLIVKTINKECNRYLDNCNMPFDPGEASTGIMNFIIFESDNYYY